MEISPQVYILNPTKPRSLPQNYTPRKSQRVVQELIKIKKVW